MNTFSLSPSWSPSYDNNIICNKYSLLYNAQKKVCLHTILFKCAYVGTWFEIQEFVNLFQAEHTLILRILGKKGFNFISNSPLFYTKAKKARLKSESHVSL